MASRLLVLTIEGHASSRLRIGQYLPMLRAEGISIENVSVGSPRLTAAELKRIALSLRRADVVFVQRIASMPLNALLFAANVRVVYDVDDALHFVRPNQVASTRRPRTLHEKLLVKYREVARGGRYYGSRKNGVSQITSFADVVIVGNDFLRGQVGAGARHVVVLPTCVPVGERPVKTHSPVSPTRIGWIGTANNLPELDIIDAAFRRLDERFGDGVLLSVVCSRPYRTESIRTEFTPWALDTEAASVARFDIGIMPLSDGRYARGKCAFKAIQCMSFGLPVVVSPVGMNTAAVDDDINGFFARTSDEWSERLSELVTNATLRQRMGRHAFEKVRATYSAEIGYQEVRRILSSVTENRLQEHGGTDLVTPSVSHGQALDQPTTRQECGS